MCFEKLKPIAIGVLCFLIIIGGVDVEAKLQSSAFQPFVSKLKSLRRGSTRLSFLLQGVDDSEPLISFLSDEALPSASITKLFTTYGALNILGPDYRFKTIAYIDASKFKDGVLRAPLIVKGYGDPFLVSERLWMFAEKIKGYGIKHVADGIVVDQSYFSDYPEFPMKQIAVASGATDPYIASLAPTSVNFNAITLAVFPKLKNRTSGNRETYSYQATAQPTEYFGRIFIQLLEGLGVKVTGGVSLREDPSSLEKKGYATIEFESLPLADLVKSANKYSNNFMTDMLVFGLGENGKGQASYRVGREKILFWLKNQGIHHAPEHFQVGSGLSHKNLVQASVIRDLFKHAWKNFQVGPEFFASLATTGGTVGTLKGRSGLPPMRAKTGSIASVSNLAGIMVGKSGQAYIVVSLGSDPSKEAYRIQQLQDNLVQEIWNQVP